MCVGRGDHLQAINQQTKTSLIVTEQNAREPQVPAPHKTTGGWSGKQKEDAIKLVVCVEGRGGGKGGGAWGKGGAQTYTGII